MSPTAPFTADFKLTPYWWEDRRPPQAEFGTTLPARADVIIIGGGVTGVETARVLAEGGRDVLVLDAGVPGEGASSRNAGQIGRNFKHPYSALKAKFGREAAGTVYAELQDAYDAVRDAGDDDPSVFGWRQAGRVIGAMSPELLDKLRREYELRARDLDEVVEQLDAEQVRSELDSPLYVGGVRLPFNGAIQPALYHQFLEARALTAGARIVGQTPVIGIARDGKGFAVHTATANILCRNVVVATNGYTGPATPWLQQRLLPIVSYMAATETISENQMKMVIPQLRTYHDNRRRSHFFSVSSDGKRILIGGRTGSLIRDLRSLMVLLHGDLIHIFPELQTVRLTHGWQGRCAAPRDLYPRFGVHEGMHYALGYTFSGMAMGPHLGRKTAALILGRRDEAQSVFGRPTFQAIPAYARGPWTMPLITGWYAWADRPKTFTRRM